MKTIENIKDEINTITTTLVDSNGKRKEGIKAKVFSRANKELAFLRMCLRYLETGPNDNFVHAQLDLVTKRLVLIQSGYATWVGSQISRSQLKNPMKTYLELFNYGNELARLKQQKDTLEYLIK